MNGSSSSEVLIVDHDGGEFPIVSRLIDFGPEPGSIVEIAQNVRTLLRTAIWTVPLDRRFGIDFSFLDLPIPVAQLQIAREVWQKINYYEPRLSVEDTSFTGNGLEGYLEPTMRLSLQEAPYPDRLGPWPGEPGEKGPPGDQGPPGPPGEPGPTIKDSPRIKFILVPPHPAP